MAKSHIQMTADKREGSGKGTARAVRRTNKVPAVIYGDNKTPVLISIDAHPLNIEYHKGHLFTALCDLNVAGDRHLVITRDLQLCPVTDKILHADFLRVTEKTVVRVEVPVHFVGHDNCPGLKEGATLTVVNHEIPLMAPANNIPDEITIDISGQPMGHSFKLADIKLPNGVKPAIQDTEAFTIATLAAPRVEEEISNAAPEAAEVASIKVASDAEVAAAKAAEKKEKK